MQNQKGQNLLEITVALGVATVIIAALAITTIKSLNNSQFSKNQVQATKLAQEGMEIVKTIRFRNYSVCIDTSNWSWNDIWANNSFGTLTPPTPCAVTCAFIIKENTTCQYGGNRDPYSLTPNTTAESIKVSGATGLYTIFQRQIFIENYATDQKKITVEVSWTDLSGPHKSQITTIFAKY